MSFVDRYVGELRQYFYEMHLKYADRKLLSVDEKELMTSRDRAYYCGKYALPQESKIGREFRRYINNISACVEEPDAAVCTTRNLPSLGAASTQDRTLIFNISGSEHLTPASRKALAAHEFGHLMHTRKLGLMTYSITRDIFCPLAGAALTTAIFTGAWTVCFSLWSAFNLAAFVCLGHDIREMEREADAFGVSILGKEQMVGLYKEAIELYKAPTLFGRNESSFVQKLAHKIFYPSKNSKIKFIERLDTSRITSYSAALT